MNLTYEITSEGYTIFKNGLPWYVQEGYFPFPAATVEESAQLHIEDIKKQMNATPPVDEIAELKQANLLLTEEVAKLKLEIMQLKAGAQ